MRTLVIIVFVLSPSAGWPVLFAADEPVCSLSDAAPVSLSVTHLKNHTQRRMEAAREAD